ncbi:MAG: bifunctional phosphoribosylaminoimidazolecarboxamide formyltransferase/IMP cyclohydrolase [Gemmatimonadales bacterium]
MRRALLSVSDKTGIVPFAKGLVERGWQLVSTGGTAKTLREGGLSVLSVSDTTGHPEIMDGRVKTLHPAVHAGLLARRSRPSDMAELAALGYRPIDLVCVNLYPFRETVKKRVTMDTAMEQVDIGGPTMVRAAAKSHKDVYVVVEPDDYDAVLAALDASDSAPLRRTLAAKAFRHVSAYDAAVAEYLGSKTSTWEVFPDRLVVSLERTQTLRYGENPDQQAAFYGYERKAGLASLEQHHGRELSYNNLLDVDGALLALAPFARTRRAAVCIIKHTTPCGLAVADTVADAYAKALATDPTSAYGSVIAFNTEVDAATATLMSSLFIECVLAPAYAPKAMETLSAKKNIRLLTYPSGDPAAFLAAYGREPEARMLRSVYGGMLAQSPAEPPFYDGGQDGKRDDWKVVTKREPTDAEWDDLRFAWAAVFGVKSNAIVLARGGAVLGIGAGQMSRVDSSRIAVLKAADARHDLKGCALASDAFFPFRDGVDAAAEAGVGAIVQPGGSVRDDEVIASADEHGMTMVLTGRRLFRH